MVTTVHVDTVVVVVAVTCRTVNTVWVDVDSTTVKADDTPSDTVMVVPGSTSISVTTAGVVPYVFTSSVHADDTTDAAGCSSEMQDGWGRPDDAEAEADAETDLTCLTSTTAAAAGVATDRRFFTVTVTVVDVGVHDAAVDTVTVDVLRISTWAVTVRAYFPSPPTGASVSALLTTTGNRPSRLSYTYETCVLVSVEVAVASNDVTVPVVLVTVAVDTSVDVTETTSDATET